MPQIKNIISKFKGNGKVKNHSSKDIWVIETTTNHPHGPPIAHKLLSKTKSPIKIDADGFKRVDGKPIEKHSTWWKIWDYFTADLYDDGVDGIKVDVSIRIKVKENHFGRVVYDTHPGWGVPIREITKIERKRKDGITRYFVEDIGWVSKERAIAMTAKGQIDNAVLVTPKNGAPYLRSVPDKTRPNFRDLIV